jgi:putative methyltransferase (TIGR04325 family)
MCGLTKHPALVVPRGCCRAESADARVPLGPTVDYRPSPAQTMMRAAQGTPVFPFFCRRNFLHLETRLAPMSLRDRLSRDNLSLLPDFAAALSSCGSGYDDDAIAEVVCAKTALAKAVPSESPPPLGVLLALAALAGSSEPWRIIDVGGAAGAHYFQVRALLPRDTQLRWTVVETPAMAARAEQHFRNGELSFHTSLSDAAAELDGPADVLLASGVLMCLPDPLASLHEFLALGPRAIVLARTGLSRDSTTRIVVQTSRLADNGPGPLPDGYVDRELRYPNTFVPQQDVDTALENSYETLVKVVEVARAWRAGGTDIPQLAYLLRRRPAEVADHDR